MISGTFSIREQVKLSHPIAFKESIGVARNEFVVNFNEMQVHTCSVWMLEYLPVERFVIVGSVGTS